MRFFFDSLGETHTTTSNTHTQAAAPSVRSSNYFVVYSMEDEDPNIHIVDIKRENTGYGFNIKGTTQEGGVLQVCDVMYVMCVECFCLCCDVAVMFMGCLWLCEDHVSSKETLKAARD